MNATAPGARSRVPGWLLPLYDRHGDKLRYLVVGVWNTVFGYGLFVVLLALFGGPVKALGVSIGGSAGALLANNYYLALSVVGWVLAVPQSTIAMKYLVFRSKGSAVREVGRAFLVYLPAQLIGMGLLKFTVSVFGMSPQAGQAATILVTTIFSYLGHKYFTFGARHAIEVVDAGGVFEDEEAESRED
jgi:putative flippase GtrA